MAKSIKLSDKKVWVSFRHNVNDTLVVQGFADTLAAEDGENFSIEEYADAKAQTFITVTPGAVILEGAKSAENAIEIANRKGI